MTDSEQNTFDDISFYIGEEEDFRASESVCDSDISGTDSESDEYWSSENESEENMMNAKSERCILDMSTVLCESKRTAMALSQTDSVPELTKSSSLKDIIKNGKAAFTRRPTVETELTMALSQTDSVHDDASPHIVLSGYADSLIDGDDEDACEIRSEIERFELLAQKATKFSPEWFELKEELVELNVLLNSCVEEEEHLHTKPLEVDEYSSSSMASFETDTCEDFLPCHGKGESTCVSNQSSERLLSHKKLDDIFLTPIYFSALLVVMAHEPSKRAARFCGTYKCGDCEEAV